MSKPRIVHALFPDLLYYQQSFHSDWGVLWEDDRLATIASHDQLRQVVEQRRSQGDYVTTRQLRGKALLPGLVNTHSHAFQRGIRGRTEFPQARRPKEDFWSWRGVMYETALRLTPDDVEALAYGVYVEMAKAGITHVGEFHYLHHQPDGTPYPDPDELTHRLLRAARGAGVRLTLLRAFYQRAGVGRPEPEGAQRRFSDPSLEFYLETLDRLAEQGHRVAVTPHSLRAVPAPALERLAQVAAQRDWPLHIHIAEQPREVEECLEEYGCRPLELLQRVGALGPRTTLVHAIHLDPAEIALIGEARAHLASCPTTERNLGDGVVAAESLLQAGARFTLGTDSQCQIAPFEDARQLEYHRRLESQSRACLFANQEQAGAELLAMLTVHGWSSLGQREGAGEIAVGQPADLIAVDLNHLSLLGWSPESLALDLVFSAPPESVRDVWSAGVEVVCEGFHRSELEVQPRLREVMARLRRPPS